MNHTQHSLSALRAEDGESQKKIFLKKLEYSATSENVDSSYENKYGLVQIKSVLSGFVWILCLLKLFWYRFSLIFPQMIKQQDEIISGDVKYPI